MLNPKQFRELVIRPALKSNELWALDLWSESAEVLLLGTALVESSLTFLKQHGDGPALGVFQMEPATHDDIWRNFLVRKERLAGWVESIAAYTNEKWPPATEMIGNLTYAAIMCRIHYLRVPERLPAADDILGMARYWKAHYNTASGAGRVEEFVRRWKNVEALS